MVPKLGVACLRNGYGQLMSKGAADNKKIYIKNWERNHKILCFEHYSKGRNECACCGEMAIEFLSIDDINGTTHRQMKKKGIGSRFYKWLIDNNFPEGFQVLCMNCNFAKGIFMECPHKRLEGE